MTMAYVRKHYNVPVKRGMFVRQTDGIWKHRALIVTRCTHYVHARLSIPGPKESPRAMQFHPLNLEYKTADGWASPPQPLEAK